MTMTQKKQGRGRPGFGGTRVILHLTPQQIEVLQKDQMENGGTRAELIRRAIDAYYFRKRRVSDINQKGEPAKE